MEKVAAWVIKDFCISDNKKRNKLYNSFLNANRDRDLTVLEIARFGSKVMQQFKIHPHFFGNHSLLMTSLHLVLFSLELPYDYFNSKYLDQKIEEQEVVKILCLFEKRISKRIPVEYITNEANYMGYKFYVNEHVLTPRSLMNTRFKDFLEMVRWENYRVLDLCTGSGCIGITLALMAPNITVDLVDISSKALEVAEVNIKHYKLENRVSCIKSDLFENIQEKYDLIITNPPYVTEREYLGQPDEVKNEPSIALKAGVDGGSFIHQIIAHSKSHLNREGILIAEIGYEVAKNVKKNYPKIPLKWFNYHNPLERQSLLDRFIKWSGYLDSIFLCSAKDLP